METNNQITKDQVHEIMRKSNNGGEIAKVLKEYFMTHFKKITPAIEVTPNPQEDIVSFAQRLFTNVETPGPVTI